MNSPVLFETAEERTPVNKDPGVWLFPYVPATPDAYIHSHKQHSLPSKLGVKQLTALLGVKPKKGSGDGKCTYTWSFLAVHPADPDATAYECEVWDYKNSRWSAFGPRWVYEALGLLVPL